MRRGGSVTTDGSRTGVTMEWSVAMSAPSTHDTYRTAGGADAGGATAGALSDPQPFDDPDTRMALAGITDQELTLLALAADPDVEVADGPSFWELTGAADRSPLPSWYMPAPFGGLSSARRSPWRRPVALLLLVAFLVIEGYGLCTTYGPTVLR